VDDKCLSRSNFKIILYLLELAAGFLNIVKFFNLHLIIVQNLSDWSYLHVFGCDWAVDKWALASRFFGILLLGGRLLGASFTLFLGFIDWAVDCWALASRFWEFFDSAVECWALASRFWEFLSGR